jgi:hypothetical protein
MKENLETIFGVLFFAAVFYFASNFYSPRWIPHYQENFISLKKNDDIHPTVNFDSLVDCQQYLHFRFGNLKFPPGILAARIMYCHSGCRRNLWDMFSPSYDEEKVGDFICPFEDRQIVGQVFAN